MQINFVCMYECVCVCVCEHKYDGHNIRYNHMQKEMKIYLTGIWIPFDRICALKSSAFSQNGQTKSSFWRSANSFRQTIWIHRLLQHSSSTEVTG